MSWTNGQNLLINSDGYGQHGTAYYMLTGADDFEFVLDNMVSKKQITDDQKSTYLTKADGYRIRFMMVGMKKALSQNGDIEAICLYSGQMNGALCAGIQHNGTVAAPYAAWIPGGAFVVAAEKGLQSKIDLPGPIDQSADWFTSAEDGSALAFEKGSYLSEYWSTFKFQKLEDQDGYKDDYRITPQIKNIDAYVFQKSVSPTGTITVAYSKGQSLTLQ